MKLKRNLCLLTMLFAMVMIFMLPGKAQAAGIQYTDNIIPTMTSNTAPSGTASASSYLTGDENFYPYLAFDHNSSTRTNAWQSATGSSIGWLEYDFAEPKCITKYTIVSRNLNNNSERPKAWTFQAWSADINQWVNLDSRSNITNWSTGVKKEFTFDNINKYSKYRLNISAIVDTTNTTRVVIGELEMMETVSAPTNVKTDSGNKQVIVRWDPIDGATGYYVYRSTTPGDPNPIRVTTGSAITVTNLTDTGLENGTTYYYTVSAVFNGVEGPKSSPEVPCTPKAPSIITGNRAILVITFNNGKEKEYDLSVDEINNFTDWYDKRSDGSGKTYFALPKYGYVKPFNARKEFVKFDNIESFEIKDYNDK